MTDSNVDHILVYNDDANEYRWSAIATNGEIVAEGESHRDRRDAIRAAQGVFGDAIPIRETGRHPRPDLPTDVTAP